MPHSDLPNNPISSSSPNRPPSCPVWAIWISIASTLWPFSGFATLNVLTEIKVKFLVNKLKCKSNLNLSCAKIGTWNTSALTSSSSFLCQYLTEYTIFHILHLSLFILLCFGLATGITAHSSRSSCSLKYSLACQHFQIRLNLQLKI